jgi:hypothetical protein
MVHSAPATFPASATFPAQARAAAAAIPWELWTCACGVALIVTGLIWDISWHMTIGRDTFWTPAHICIQLGGILAGCTSTYLIFSTTFGSNAVAQASSIKVWGFRGPTGAFLACWGGTVMVTSAPFDNWWHNSFGLDVEILSPPHVVLGQGILGVSIGTLLMVVARRNRAEGLARERLTRLMCLVGGLMISLHTILLEEYLDPAAMHSAMFYRVLCLGVPCILVALAVGSGYRWTATVVTSIYMSIRAGLLWILPLFPADPKLGPVYTRVTHMVPMSFPLLLIGPALVIDFVVNRMEKRNKWLEAAILGPAYLAALIAVQWPFGSFMISPLARNWFFGMNYFGYFMRPQDYHFAWQFEPGAATPGWFWPGLLIALTTAAISTRIGLALGGMLRRLQR